MRYYEGFRFLPTGVSYIDRSHSYAVLHAVHLNDSCVLHTGHNNHIAEHHLQTNHRITWGSAKCVTYSTDYYQRIPL